MPKSNREDFSQRTIEIVAKRAGFICSWPNCNERTVGPGTPQDKVVNIGVAAHINAASPGGPRYNPQQNRAERTSLNNAIWLCQDHAKLADSDPTKYYAKLLQQWKQEHEERIGEMVGKSPGSPITEVSGEHIARGRGNVTGLDIQGSAIIKPGTRSFAEGEGNITGTKIGGSPG
jgi:hypothetical protein